MLCTLIQGVPEVFCINKTTITQEPVNIFTKTKQIWRTDKITINVPQALGLIPNREKVVSN